MEAVHPIRVYRQLYGITVAELADKLEISRVTISRWENWTRPVARSLWDRVHAVTGIPIASLATARQSEPETEPAA